MWAKGEWSGSLMPPCLGTERTKQSSLDLWDPEKELAHQGAQAGFHQTEPAETSGRWADAIFLAYVPIQSLSCFHVSKRNRPYSSQFIPALSFLPEGPVKTPEPVHQRGISSWWFFSKERDSEEEPMNNEITIEKTMTRKLVHLMTIGFILFYFSFKV